MKKLITLLMIAGLVVLTGCETTRSGSGSSSSRYAALKRGRSDLNMHVVASKQLNSAKGDKSAPVLVKVYQLKDAGSFQSASFKDIWQRDIAVLGYSLLRQSEFMVKPGSIQDVDIKRNHSARYFAVAAIFKHPDTGKWRAVKSVADLGNRHQVRLKLQGNHIALS